ncbi:MAG TPA: hypothetical protein PLM53_07260 [Spirochaetota bacterium]|nr:hypothetical protein [Spirochaetota bacterium]HPC40786.1 hypothetical protein [Spirochaetota bacterium]HPL15765.1 hypothetical protein [Spirochaetota bacterium]HQF07824.1 hypothetical protein [Spirochaetota bacterium]HQH96877.1 hypothetical protein [Spirochaetota bacterium]
MRSFVILTSAMLLALAGCVTMPDPVPADYLVDKTADQSKVLEKLENSIIAKNHEIKTLKDRDEAAGQKVKVEKGRLDILKNEKNLLEEKKKQYQLENDLPGIDENNKQLAVKDAEIKTQETKLEHAKTAFEFARAQREVGEAELSVMVAELNYEKSRIAREYLVKRFVANPPAEGDKKKTADPDKYDEQYRKYLEKQREILVEKRNARDEASLKLKIAEDKLKN